MLRSPNLEDLLAADKLDDVIALLQAREHERRMEPRDWLVYGHALNRRYGSLQRVGMLDKYAQAVREKAVDSTALENTINALSDEKAHDRAMVVLEDWPASDDPTSIRTSGSRPTSPTRTSAAPQRRRSAAEAQRAPAARVRGVAASALQDVKSQSCVNDAAKRGLEAIKSITDRKEDDARAAFGAANPMPLLLRLGNAELANMRCVPESCSRRPAPRSPSTSCPPTTGAPRGGYLPPICISAKRIDGARSDERSSMSAPTRSRPFIMSSMRPAMVTSSTGNAMAPSMMREAARASRVIAGDHVGRSPERAGHEEPALGVL